MKNLFSKCFEPSQPLGITPGLQTHQENGDGDIAQLVRAPDRHAADAGSIPRCGEGFFSQSQLSVQTLLRVSVHPRVQSHALTSVRTWKSL